MLFNELYLNSFDLTGPFIFVAQLLGTWIIAFFKKYFR